MFSTDARPSQVRADPVRYRDTLRVTWVSIAVNIVLSATQLAVGLAAYAQSLVADSIHTASDVLADFLVLYANRRGSHPADSEHPYGHGRIETAASLVLGALLVGVGASFLFSAGSRLQSVGELPPVGAIALWVALATLAAKEGLFRYMLRVAERLRSPMLIANAWHARSDAASSLVVAVGIGGSLLGYRFLDLLAAAVVGFLIARMGWQFAYDALRELIDTALDEEEVQRIEATLAETPGVIDVHEVRTRRMAHKALVDAHVQVDPRISVSEGHLIAETARSRVLRKLPDVLDVLVHVDAECDVEFDPAIARLPARTDLVRHLEKLLGPDVPKPERTVLHYLGSKVEADVFLPPSFFSEQERVVTLSTRLANELTTDPYFRAVTLNSRFAP